MGGSKGQGSLVCYSPWDSKKSDMTSLLNNNKNKSPLDLKLDMFSFWFRQYQFGKYINQNIERNELYTVLLRFFHIFSVQFNSVAQSVRLFVTPWIAAQASLSITNSQSLLKLMPIESVMPDSHLILCRPLLLLPPIPPSIRVFSNESILRIRWPKYWSFSFSMSPSNEHPGLICFRMDWLDLLAVQRTHKSLHQHHSSKVSILWHSAF